MAAKSFKYSAFAQWSYGLVRKAYADWYFKKYTNIEPIRVVLGANFVHQKGWIPTDIESLNILDEHSWKKRFAENSISALLAEHVWEHLTLEQGKLGAKYCYRFLKKGGYIRVAVPDGHHPDPAYIEGVRPGGSGKAAWDHQVLYTVESLSEIFQEQGFKVNVLEAFDAQGEFQFREWDPSDGMIYRSSRYDERNWKKPLNYTSLIIDARK